ncbi:MAG: MFS transporter [Chloroflexi bacterium]|nr:MFS transporter [Chloroflexota bacterium]
MAFPVGAWIDRHGARHLMTLGSVCATLLVIAWSTVSTLPAFYALWIGLGICGAAVLYDPAFAVVAHWFHARRSTALVVITLAAGLASTIFLPLSDALLNAFGWRMAVLILGLFLGVVTIPLHLLVLRRRPEDMGLLPDGAVQQPGVPRSALQGTPVPGGGSGAHLLAADPHLLPALPGRLGPARALYPVHDRRRL